MKFLTKISLLVFLFSACSESSKDYSNKSHYSINVGEKVEIYYSTNSCCYYCVANRGKLNVVELLEDKTVDAGEEDCAGCDVLSAFVFQGKKVGIDTIVLRNPTASQSCMDTALYEQKYIIEVK